MKELKRLFAMVLAVCMVCSLAACGSAGGSSKGGASEAPATESVTDQVQEAMGAVRPKNGDHFVVGYTASAYAIAPWAHALGDNIQKMCDDNGWELVMLAAEADMSLQTEHVASLILQDVDIIVLLAGDTSIAVTWAEDIHNAGIPAIFVAADVEEEGHPFALAYVGPDQYQFSADMAQAIVDKYGADAGLTVVAINAVPEQYDFVQREQGFKSVMDQTNYNYVGPEYAYVDRSLAVQIMENYISAYGDDIDILVGFDDDITLGGVQAIAEAGLDGQIAVYSITGQSEAFAAIKGGTMTMTVQNRTADIVDRLAEVISQYIAGEAVEYMQPTTVNVVTADNVDDYTPEF